MSGPQLREDDIGRALADAERSGELRSAPSYGKPLAPDAGWEDTPTELRMGFKILKNAGMAPPEVAWFHERARLRAAASQAASASERTEIETQLALIEQRLALRLEALRASGSL